MTTTTSAAELRELAARFRRVADRVATGKPGDDYARGLAAGMRLAAELLDVDAEIAVELGETAGRPA